MGTFFKTLSVGLKTNFIRTRHVLLGQNAHLAPSICDPQHWSVTHTLIHLVEFINNPTNGSCMINHLMDSTECTIQNMSLTQ